MAINKKLNFHAAAQIPSLEGDHAGASRDIWLATWGVVAIFVIVVLVLFFTGQIGVTGAAGVALVPEQKACTRGNAVTDMGRANDMLSMGAMCESGLTPYTRCCWWPQ
jgi:hypothetical protein